MTRLWHIFCFLLLWLAIGVNTQTSYYKRTYYSPIISTPSRYYSHSSSSADYGPISYTSDLLTEESKRNELTKKYPKKLPFRPASSDEDEASSERYSSAEYLNEAHAYPNKEDDSREYTIGTHIRVQHPVTVPKKSVSPLSKYNSHIPSPYKSNTYASEPTHSGELHDSKLPAPPPPPPPTQSKKHIYKYTQYFEPDPFHVVTPPRTTVSSAPPSSPSLSYNVYEPEQDDYERAPSSRAKVQLRDRFKGVASKKQIEKYLEDQQKLLDEALKLQLLNNPKFQHLLKAKEPEPHYDESEYEELPIDPQPPPLYRPNFDDNLAFKQNRPPRRPQAAELKRSPKPKPPTPGLSKSKRRFRSAIVINV